MKDSFAAIAVTASAFFIATLAILYTYRKRERSYAHKRVEKAEATPVEDRNKSSNTEDSRGDGVASNVKTEQSGRLSRPDIVRKLIADPSYRIEVNESVDSVRSKIDDTMKAVLWDIIHEDVKRKDFSKLIVLLRELIQKVNDLTPHRVDLHTELRGVVDIDLIQRLLETDEISQTWLDTIVDFVIRKRILVLESPARNEETMLWLKRYKAEASRMHDDPTFLLKGFRQFLDYCHKKIEEIELDMANHQISCLAAIVEDRGYAYYRELFEAGLRRGEYDLVNMQQWIRDVTQRYADKKWSLQTLHAVGILNIVMENVYSETLTNQKVPETFGSDWPNLLDVARIMRGLCRTAICLLRLKQLLVRVKVSFEVLGKKIHALLLQRAPQAGVSVRGDHIYVALIGDKKGGLSEKLSAKLVVECTAKALLEYDEELTKQEVDKLYKILPGCLAGSRDDPGKQALVESLSASFNLVNLLIAYVGIVKRLHADAQVLLLRERPLDEILQEESLNVRNLNLGPLLIDELLQLSYGLEEIIKRDYGLHKKEYTTVYSQTTHYKQYHDVSSKSGDSRAR